MQMHLEVFDDAALARERREEVVHPQLPPALGIARRNREILS